MLILHKDLFDILLGYSALVPPRILNFPFHLLFDDVHDFLVESVLLAHDLPHLKAYPPSNAYQYTFWKWAIRCLEEMSTNQACIVYQLES
jgi:protein-lysine N-methyltransferase EEF2KMT